jgi:hypothetical protein
MTQLNLVGPLPHVGGSRGWHVFGLCVDYARWRAVEFHGCLFVFRPSENGTTWNQRHRILELPFLEW